MSWRHAYNACIRSLWTQSQGLGAVGWIGDRGRCIWLCETTFNGLPSDFLNFISRSGRLSGGRIVFQKSLKSFLSGALLNWPIMSRCPYFQFLDGFNDTLSRFRAIRASILILQSSRDTMMFLFRHWSCLGGHADLRHCCFQHDSSEVPHPPVKRAGFDQCTATRWYIECRSHLCSFF